MLQRTDRQALRLFQVLKPCSLQLYLLPSPICLSLGRDNEPRGTDSWGTPRAQVPTCPQELDTPPRGSGRGGSSKLEAPYWILIFELTAGHGTHAYNYSSWKAEAGDCQKFKANRELHNEFRATLNYPVSSCLKLKIEKNPN